MVVAAAAVVETMVDLTGDLMVDLRNMVVVTLRTHLRAASPAVMQGAAPVATTPTSVKFSSFSFFN